MTMNLTAVNGEAVHSPAKGVDLPRCTPTGVSRLGGFSSYRRTSAPVTCKRCLKYVRSGS